MCPRSNYWIKVIFSQGPAITSLSLFSKGTLGVSAKTGRRESGEGLCMFNIDFLSNSFALRLVDPADMGPLVVGPAAVDSWLNHRLGCL